MIITYDIVHITFQNMYHFLTWSTYHNMNCKLFIFIIDFLKEYRGWLFGQSDK